MKIISIQERTVSLASAMANAAIAFDAMTASAVVVEIETKTGRFAGLGFSSIGRFGHGGLLRERFIPRLKAASPSDFIDPATEKFSMAQVWALLMKNEKEGGHGERSGAVGVLETALWDAWAKSEGLPLWALLQREFGHPYEANSQPANSIAPGRTRIYASGGHYPTDDSNQEQLADEVKQTLDQGYGWFKMKIGGTSIDADLVRIERALSGAGQSHVLAVDANCAYEDTQSEKNLSLIDDLQLRWIEEPVNPLSFQKLAYTKSRLLTPIATGENIFSTADTQNLLNYGGLQPGKDVLQMDCVLSYGICEYMRMINFAVSHGWSRRDFYPHAGHQAALHICAGLGLGGHETASARGPFGGVSQDTKIEDGIATLGDRPGAGIENKPSLFRLFDGMLN